MTCKSALLKLGVALVFCSLGVHGARAWQADNGDGTFENPVLYADYPDPDIIRVTNDFFMVSTTFVDNPGITVLHSKDLVNWEIFSHAATNLDGGNAYNLIGGTAYQSGFWASSIRYYNGTFYVVANPTFANSRIYYTTDLAGPWQYYQLNQVAYDPGFFIETNGTGYIVCGHGPQSILTLNSNYSQVVAVANDVVDSGGEGSHLVKRGSYYYLFNANPGTWPYQLRCSRATNIFGIWETGHICLTETTGGHQGAIVDINDSDQWYGFVHQDSGSVGRMPRIGPVFWENNWPVFGTTGARDQMAASYTKPIAGQPLMQPATSDDFSGSTLGLQWQWNHNPDNTRWSLTERPGYLRLRPTLAASFWTARNTLTQKGQGPQSYGIVKLDLSNLQPGDIAGFGTLGKVCGNIAVNVPSGGAKTLSTTMIKDQVGSYTWASGVTISGNTLYLRTDLNFANNLGICSYSLDGTNWTTLGGDFELMWGYGSTFQGEKFALFCYNTNTVASTGYVDVDSFTFGTTAPLVTVQRGRPKLNAARTTFVGDNGQPLRGPFTSTEWTSAVPADQIANMKNLGFNAVHLYAESFDPSYPTNGSTAPGYHVAEVDKIVAATRTNGLYLVMTIGNGAYNGSYNRAWITNFWNLYAPRYANETHVLYEIQNEPVKWGPAYLTAQSPPGALDMEVAAYNTIRASAPNTPVLIFSYAVFGGTGGADAALTDIHAFNGAVFGNTNAVWTNVAVGFHGYAGWDGTSTAVASLLSAGYPCFMTEFAGGAWGSGAGGIDVQLTGELERLGVSWLTFQHVPPTGVSDDVTDPTRYTTLVDNAGLAWTPDYGSWPVARGVFGNGGVPRATPDFTNSFLSGTLRIQAEDFDTGGEGVAYHDTDSANNGGQYRPSEGVDITTCNDTGGGYKVGWTANGEWLEYTMFVRNAGYYNLGLRYATPNSGCAARVICNARDKAGAWTLPMTGSSTTWVTATQQVFLEWGRQKLRLEILTGGFDLNWIELSPASTGPIADGTYRFLNAANALAMQEPSGGGDIIITNDSSSTDWRWNLHHVGAGQYQVSSAANNYYWISGDRLGSVWWSGTGGDRCFIVPPAGGGYYRFVPAGNGLYLQTTGANPTNVTQAVSAGTANQQWAILASSAPAFPIGLSAVAVTSTQVSLTWNAVAGATSYNVRRSTTSGGPYATIATGVTTTNYTDNVATAMKYYYVVSAVVSGVESLNSAEAALRFPKLTGTIIGTLGSYNSSGNTITNVFDNNLNTFFDGPTGNGCWVGLDFGVGASNLITQINYCPRSGFESRMVGGIFQGANQSNFSDAVTLFTVTAQPPAGAFTSVNITNTAAFRYVRYLSPNNGWGNVAELEFYGYPFSIPVPVPSGLIAQALSASQINLTWNALTNATSYNVKRSPASGGPYTTFATGVTTTNYTDTVTVGMKYYYVVSAICSGQETPNSVEATLNLPYPWLTQDVGAVGIPGGASYSSGVFTATGSGDDIWNAADAFRFIYVTNSGDCTIVARVISVQNIDAWSKAGVMIRASLASNAPNAMVAVTPGNGVTFQYRLTTNGTCSFANTTGLSAPYWVKLVRSGNTFAGYRSTDGTNWTQQGTTTTIVMGTTVNVGLALTSHNNTSLFAATFDNVTAPGWSSPMPPPAPTGLVAVPWTAQATLNWAASGTATSYNVKRATTNGGPYAIVANVTTTNSTDTGLINGTNYFYVVSALNPAGESTNSAQVNATPQLPVPPAPAGLVAAAVFSGQINLTWSVVTNAATYNVKRSTTNGGPYAVVASGVTGTNYNDTGLAAVTTFYYVVSAVNTGGESTNSAQVSATTPMAPPAAPAGLTATAVSTLQINLSWTASAGAESYNVKRSTTNGGPYTVIATGLTTTNYPNSGLDGGTVYYYVVSAVNSGGESTNSAQAAAATFSPTLGSLVHRYSFGETSGSTVADSVGGPVWTGTLPNGGTLSGGQLALTSGSQQYANLPSGVVSSLSNITVMVWLNLASVTYWSRLFDFGNDTTTYMYLTPWNGFDHTTRFTISTSGAGGEQKINCSQGVSPGAWHQLAVTLNAGVGVLYMDGLAVGTNSGMTLKPSSLGNTTRNYLGKSQSTSDPYLNGSLDEFRIYNVALSSAEIAATAALGPDQLLSTNPPTMSLALTETNLVITWPVACAGYTVQARTNLVSDSWVNVPSPAPQIVGAQWQVTLPGPGDNSAAFYRLAK